MKLVNLENNKENLFNSPDQRSKNKTSTALQELFGKTRECLPSMRWESLDSENDAYNIRGGLDYLMEELKKNWNKPFDIQNTLITSISNVICSLVFGKRFDYVDAKLESVPETYSAFYVIYRYVVPLKN